MTTLHKLLTQYRPPGHTYVEPFCGNCTTLAKISNPRIGNDKDANLIALLQYVQKGWMPVTCCTPAPHHVGFQQYCRQISDKLADYPVIKKAQ